MRDPRLDGWSEDAIKAMQDNPNYFVWWYTAKSMALVAALAAAVYFYGKARGLEKKRGRRV
jgi:hypothetical protein